MKIVSLQSVGLGDSSTSSPVRGEYSPYLEVSPLIIRVDAKCPCSSMWSKVVSIELDWSAGECLRSKDGHRNGPGRFDPEYLVRTEDKHIFVFPAKSYIAEWVEVEE